jgi:hypothetical protein
MRWLCAACCLLLAGCASIRDACHQDVLYHRMQHEAARVWDECEANYAAQPWFDHFERGFKDGYIGVAMGHDGCPPTLPRNEYWHPRYRTAEGKAQITAWYHGYAVGAQTALSVGVHDRNRLPTAIEVFGRGDTFLKTSGTASLSPIPAEDVLPPTPEIPALAPPASIEPPPAIQPPAAIDPPARIPPPASVEPSSFVEPSAPEFEPPSNIEPASDFEPPLNVEPASDFEPPLNVEPASEFEPPSIVPSSLEPVPETPPETPPETVEPEPILIEDLPDLAPGERLVDSSTRVPSALRDTRNPLA